MGDQARTASLHACTPAPELRLLFDAPLRTATAPDIALDALAVLRRQGLRATLTFVKHDSDSEVTLLDLRARAVALDVAEDVRFDATCAARKDADALLVLHRWAGETLEVALGAMRDGLPIVACPQGGARRFFDEHPFAVRAKSCSGRDVAAAVASLAADELTRRRNVTRAREYVTRARNAHLPA